MEFALRLRGVSIASVWLFWIKKIPRNVCCGGGTGFSGRKPPTSALAMSIMSFSPCGYVFADDGDKILLYYGAADSCIALATASLKELLDWLKANGEPEPSEQ
jgi:hypothetical protein